MPRRDLTEEGSYMISLLLGSIVEKKDLSVRRNASLRTLIELMNKNDKGVVVVLAGRKPLGILTERDIVELLFNGVDLDETAEQHARKHLITTKSDRTIGYALNLMIDNNIRRMIVLDEENDFLGVITQKDMLRHLENDFYRAAIRVRHLLDRLQPLISAPPDAALNDVLKIIVKHKISSVPLVKSGRAVGIITEKDIIKLAARRVPLARKVSGYMSKPVIAVDPATTLVDVVAAMNDRDIRRVVVNDEEGRALGIITIKDVLRNLEGDYSEFLERKLRHAKDVLNLLPEMMIEVSDARKEHLVAWVNEMVLTRFGRKLIDRPVTRLIPVKTWEKICSGLRRSGTVEDVRFRKDSQIYELSGFFIKTDGKAERGRIQLIIRDITEDIRLSTTDPLTGLYNRRFIHEFLVKEIERSKRLDKSFSVVILDLDDFKRLNDTYGHPAGDAVLRTIAQMITDNVRRADIAGRYGGEEFIVIMPESASGIASYAAERLRSRIEQQAIELPKKKRASLTASFGVATFPQDGTSPDDLLVAADDRLYRAKREGKNRVVFE